MAATPEDKPPVDTVLRKVLEAIPFQLTAEGGVHEARRRLRDLPRRPPRPRPPARGLAALRSALHPRAEQ